MTSKYNWPTREQWAAIQRTAYYDYFEDLPRSNDIADYASPEETTAAIAALKAIWCDYGRRLKEAKQLAGPVLHRFYYDLSPDEQKLCNHVSLFKDRRAEINQVIKALREGHYHYKFDSILKRAADPEHATPCQIDPVLVSIQSRYRAAYEVEAAEIIRRAEARPIDDAAWERELQRRRDIDAHLTRPNWRVRQMS